MNLKIKKVLLNVMPHGQKMPARQGHDQNSIIIALAGASRIFAFMDEDNETDEGYVTLVNAKEEKECSEKTNLWAWRHPHSDGTVTYVPTYSLFTNNCLFVRIIFVSIGRIACGVQMPGQSIFMQSCMSSQGFL